MNADLSSPARQVICVTLQSYPCNHFTLSSEDFVCSTWIVHKYSNKSPGAAQTGILVTLSYLQQWSREDM